MKAFLQLLFLPALFVSTLCTAQKRKPPVMGWSSWNHFHVNITEQMIREQADAMISAGMYEAGYRFITIDDGYFGGRDGAGKLFANGTKFPSGMKALTGYLHGKGLKTGIYTDAGKNTCGSLYDKDSLGIGAGMHGHLKVDFLKVGWCREKPSSFPSTASLY